MLTNKYHNSKRQWTGVKRMKIDELKMVKNENICPTKMTEIEMLSDDEDENLTYAQLRDKRIQENMSMLEILGVNEAAEKLANNLRNIIPVKIKKQPQQKYDKTSENKKMPIRHSVRIANITSLPVNVKNYSTTVKPLTKKKKLLLSFGDDVINQIYVPNEDLTFFKHLNAGIVIKAINNCHRCHCDRMVKNENVMPSYYDQQIEVKRMNKEMDGLKMVKNENISRTKMTEIKMLSGDEDENLTYTQLRDKRIKENMGMLEFTTVVKSLNMFKKSLSVTESCINSLAVHPSETNLIIATGDSKGNIALFNKNNGDSRSYHMHNAAVNCISFCTWDPYKLFSTSRDGSVRCGDIKRNTFDFIYTPIMQLRSKVSHTTWHTEYERNLLVGTGSGHVDLIDVRKPYKIDNTSWCHRSSVRTFQCHPLEKNYFLTSSGVGEVSLWDIRFMTNKSIYPVFQYEHSRALLSAFYSASGTKMVSTSSDDKVRIFNTSQLDSESAKPVKEIQHKTVSRLKAKWYPHRDDTFFIGSMETPKRFQIFFSDGKLLHSVSSEKMTTICPVIEVHPTRAIFVGGNLTGRLHIFSTEKQF